MKVFISHSSHDKNILIQLCRILDKFGIKYWADIKAIDEGNPIPSKINEGLAGCTHFFLLWSKAASESNFVKMETDTVLSPPYMDTIKRIPFVLDQTTLPYGFASIPYHRISIDNIETEMKKVLNKIRADLELSSQLTLFKDTVCEHYENLPPKPDIPIISNFRKFDGYKYYVQQSYIDLTINKKGSEIGKHILSLIRQNLENIKLRIHTQQQLQEYERELRVLGSDHEVKQYLGIIHDLDDPVKAKRHLLLMKNLSERAVTLILENEKKPYAASGGKKDKIRMHKLRSKDRVASSIISLGRLNIQTANLSSSDLLKIEQVKGLMKDLGSFIKLNGKVKELYATLSNLDEDHIIPIVGDYGSGKSALCHDLIYSICKHGFEEYIPIFVPLGQLPRHDEITNHLQRDIYNFVDEEYGFKLSYDEFDKKIQDGKVILILDALDEMSNKLDDQIAQNNLNHCLELSRNSVTVLTSRHTYFSGEMESKLLLKHNKLIKILDFSTEEIEAYLNLYLKTEEHKIAEIKHSIEENKLGDLTHKPLFLNVICDKFEELKGYFPINESVILQVLTEEWIKHDVESKRELDLASRKKTKNERQRISEILACYQYEKGRPIGRHEIMREVKDELQYEDSEAKNRLNQYYKDAINSTFLVREPDERYRFILNPVIEYFVARRIINDIGNRKIDQFLGHIKMIRSPETFEFIRGISDIEWAIRPHVFINLKGDEDYDILRSYENHSQILSDLINDIRNGKYQGNIGNVVKMLYVTGNLPPRPDLSKLNLTGIDLSNSNLKGANMTDGSFNGINLRGCSLQKAKLQKAKLSEAKLGNADLTGADLTGADLTYADLSNADLKEADLQGTNLANANLANANLTGVIVGKTTILKNTNFSHAIVSGIDLSEVRIISGAKFIGVDLQTTKLPSFLQYVDFREAVLTKLNLDRSDLSHANLREADLTNIRLQHAKLNYTDLRWSKLLSADVFKASFSGARLYQCDVNGTNIDLADISGADLYGIVNR